MLNTSLEYKTAISAPSRMVRGRVEVFFDGDAQPPVSFQDDDIVYISLLEENSVDYSNPIGRVSSNEATVSFNNSNRYFTPSNINSPYYNKLRPKVRIRPYLSLEVADNVFEEVPLGTFRAGDWNAPSSSAEATIVCWDRLNEIMELDVPLIRVQKNATVKTMFEMLFAKLGLNNNEYNVDNSLSQVILRGWLEDNSVRSALNSLCVAGNCNVIVDRHNVIRVRPNVVNQAHVTTLNDETQIEFGDNPQRFLDTYSTVKVKYKIPFLKDRELLLRIDDLVLPTGDTILSPLTFTNGPVMTVEEMRLMNAKNTRIVDINYGAWTASITLNNAGVSEIVSLEIWGQPIGTVGAEHVVTSAGATFQKTITIENALIQSQDAANGFGSNLLQYVSDPTANFKFTLRGDPSIELNDVVKILDPADRIPDVNIIVTRHVLKYDGSLSAVIDGRRAPSV